MSPSVASDPCRALPSGERLADSVRRGARVINATGVALPTTFPTSLGRALLAARADDAAARGEPQARICIGRADWIGRDEVVTTLRRDLLARRATPLAEQAAPIARAAGVRAALQQTRATIVGVALPGAALPSCAWALQFEPLGADETAQRLRHAPIPATANVAAIASAAVIARVAGVPVLLGCRTLFDDEVETVVAALTDGGPSAPTEASH